MTNESQHIVLLCAGQRGRRFLATLAKLLPAARLTVFSFRETSHEPPFLDDIRALTEQTGGTFYQARYVGGEDWQSFWAEESIDLMLMVGWRYMVPPRVYQRARQGAFVFHDSLLPAYRGFSPTVWAMINGEDHSGVTLFEVVEAVDAGDIVDQARVSIGPDETIADIVERITDVYLEILEHNIHTLLAGSAPRQAQDHAQATYTCKRLPEDNRIDWTDSSENIYNLIRAVTRPYPGAFTTLDGQRLTIWAARRLPDAPIYVGRVPGRVVDVRANGVVILTGDGSLLLTEVQLADGERLSAPEIITSIQQTLGR